MRGDFVTIAMQGNFGKPRPALVIQADQFNEHASVTVLPVTGTLVAAPLLSGDRSTRCGQWLAEALPGDGGQGHDRQARQNWTIFRAH